MNRIEQLILRDKETRIKELEDKVMELERENAELANSFMANIKVRKK